MLRRDTLHIALDAAVTKTASYAPPAKDYNLDRFNELVITLNITAAERTTAQTYDFYVITGDGTSEWDLVHFPQIAVAGPTRLTARVLSSLLPQTVSPAAPGVAAMAPGIINTLTTNAPKTLGAGLVAHGPWGNYLRYELVCAGAITTGITYTVQVEAVWSSARAAYNAGSSVAGPSGAPPLQANTSGGSGGSTTNTQNFTVPVTAGNLLVLYIFDSTDLTTTITNIAWVGGNSGVFTPTPLSPINGTTRRMWCYTAQITASTGTGVTVTFSASINSVVIFAEYPGMVTSGVIDGEVAANGTGTAISSGNLVTTNANDLLLGGIFVTSSGGGTLSPGSGFTMRVNNSSTSHRGLEDQNVAAAGTYAATASYSSSQTWIAHLLALKRTSGAGVRTPQSFYISNAGNDANTGLDAAHSWAHAPGMTGATGAAAGMALIPGDAVLLKRGDSWLNTTLTVPVGGSASGQVTLGAYGSGARPIISGAVNSPAITATAANMGYWTIDNIDVRTSGATPGINTLASIYHNYWDTDLLPVPNWVIQNCASNAAFFLGGPNTIVRNNTLDGTANSSPAKGGIIVRGAVSTGALIEGNNVSNFKDRGIWVLRSANNPVIRYNTVHDILTGTDNEGMGINLDGFEIPVTGGQTYGNQIFACAGIGITHENGIGCRASYNLIHDCVKGGIDAINYSTYQTQPTNLEISYNVIYNVNIGIPIWDAQGLVIVGNTIYNGTGANSQGFGIQSLDTNVAGLTFQNNVIAGAWTHPIQVRTAKAIWTAFDYNDVMPAGTEVLFQAGTATSQTLAQLQALGLMSHGITANPLFKSTVTPDLSLASGSPAIGSGVNLGAGYQQALQSSTAWPDTIIIGPQAAQWNMGAYLSP